MNLANRLAWGDMLAYSEIGPDLLAISDNGYNVCVGSTPEHPILFTDYSDHPHKYFDALKSDAAGRYQIMGWIFHAYKPLLNLPDFGKTSQDLIMFRLTDECHAIDDIDAGRIEQAVYKCRSRWASLPGAGYGQHENKMTALLDAFQKAGGVCGVGVGAT